MIRWFALFWIFVKVNLLTTSGPASVGLLYKEAVGSLMTESAHSLRHLYMPNVTAEVAEAFECPILTARQGYGVFDA